MNSNNDLIQIDDGICMRNDEMNTFVSNDAITPKNIYYFFETWNQCLLHQQHDEVATEVLIIKDQELEIDTKNETKMEEEENEDKDKKQEEEERIERESEKAKQKTNTFNFASFDSGAIVLSKSDGIKSAKSILINRRDKYMMMPCELKDKWFIIQLSEDIVIDKIQLLNYEHYSSNFKHIQIYGKTSSDNDDAIINDQDNDDNNNNINKQQDWILISDFILKNQNENFITFTEKNWVRLLKIEILSYYGNEYYCTVTQIRVFGSTMLPHWKEELLTHLDHVEHQKHNITSTSDISSSSSSSSDTSSSLSSSSIKSTKAIDSKESVFTILTKRMASLELNLTKQQLKVSNLLDKFTKIQDLDEEYQINLTNHMLFQSYAISIMLKTLNNNSLINGNLNENTNSNDNANDNNKYNKYNTFTQDWTTSCSQNYKQTENKLDKIENYMDNLSNMMTNLYWIGIIIIISQIIIFVMFILFICGYCGNYSKRHKSSHHPRLHSQSHSSLKSTKNKFSLSRTLSHSTFNFKRNRKKFKK